MKPEDQKIIDILTQIAEGKEWQFSPKMSPLCWYGASPGCLKDAIQAMTQHHEIRLKPAPKMRLIKMDELPPVFWITKNCQPDYDAWALCTGVGPASIMYIWPGGKQESVLLSSCDFQDFPILWSKDRLSRHSFLVEGKEGE